ncbi:hypothetical protein KDL01_15410 [Actinospica durhamensis]|uniref:Uncharacterized protein n=1 Tax=Actinospica durhamensis TaxID=1508375 RepID=A0A941ENU0_9ACTN|nr:hypothetical protein [Actinospica durhamensis]MBR7834661.1 hypothetical protein [Actinospica durhamensis]
MLSYGTNGRVPRPQPSHRITVPPNAPVGPARSTRDTRGEITAVLEQVVRDWPRQPAHSECFHTRLLLQDAPYPIPKSCTVTPRQLAGQLLASDRFRALRLGGWLRRPDRPTMRAAVEALSPPPLREDVELLFSALALAAENQRERRRATAILVWLLLSALVSLAVVLVSRG